jgi:PAS domain S-box-containing protein
MPGNRDHDAPRKRRKSARKPRQAGSRKPAAPPSKKAKGRSDGTAAAIKKLEAGHRSDVAERGHDRDAIRQGQERYRALADNIDLGIAMISRDYKVLSMNAFLCQIVGRPIAALLGTDCFRRFENRDKPCPDCPGARALATGRRAEREARAVPNQDPPTYARVQAYPVLGPDGRAEGFIEIVEDVTDRKRAEDAIRQSEQRRRAILNTIPDPVWLKDLEGRFLAVNEAWCRFAGLSEREALGKTVRELFPPKAAERIEKEDRQVIRTGKTFRSEESLPSADGRLIWFETMKMPFHGDCGAVVGTAGIARDVTDRRRLQEEFLQSQKMEAIGRLAGGIAHDFRNQLAVIKGYAEMLARRGLVREEGLDKLQEILKAADRSTELTGKLLAFSRRDVLQPLAVDLCQRVAAMAKTLPQMIGEDIRLTVSACEDACVSSLDPAQFEQAMMNLAANARDAMPAGGDLRIEVSPVETDAGFARRHPDVRPGPMVLVAVSDTGCGMNGPTRERAFEPFFTTKAVGKGTGLGLSMVYGFVRQSGGAIEVQSEPQRGTTFRLYFLRSADAARGHDGSPAVRSTPRGGEAVLLVEDDRPLRSMMVGSLRECGYEVVEARDARQALRLARNRRTRIDLLLTDVVMPGMRGTELAAAFRRVRKDVPILYVSGHASGDLEGRGIEKAGGELMTKPFKHEELARRVRRALDAGASRKQSGLRKGG